MVAATNWGYDMNSYRANWVWMMARGVFAILIGLVMFYIPAVALSTAVLVFSFYVAINGTLAVVAALSSRASLRQCLFLGLEGVFGIAVAVAAMVWPAITLLFLTYVIAFWAFATGFTELSVAYRLRHGRGLPFLLGLVGLLTLSFGVFVLFYPASGVLFLVTAMAGYCILSGVLSLAWSRRLFKIHSDFVAGPTQLPTPAIEGRGANVRS